MTMNKILALLLALLTAASFVGCGAAAPAETTAPTAAATTEPVQTEQTAVQTADTEPAPADADVPEDGVYTVDFNTDSAMFHANESCDGKAKLTVADGRMTAHVTLAGKGFLNVFVGSSEDAKRDGAAIIDHTEDEVTYSDGFTETVYGFDIPVPALDTDFNLAVIGKKGTWYDHTISFSNPEKAE